MNTFRHFAVLSLLCAMPAAVFARAAAQQPDYAGIAREVVSALAQGHWSALEARFDQRMQTALPEDKLSAVWQQITAQVGAFDRIIAVQVGEKDSYHVAVATCVFAHANLDAKVVIDSSGHIAGLFFAPAAAASSAANAPQPASAWTPPDYVNPSSFEERPATLGSGTAWPLPAVLSTPHGKGPFPAIVLVHGSGPHDQDETIGPNKPFKDLAEGLASQGIVVLRYEKRTHAAPGRAAAADALFTVHDETMNDAEAAVRLLSTMSEVDAKHIYLLGHSLGGMLAPRIAAEDPQIAGIVLMAATARPLEKVIVEQLKYLAALPGHPDRDAMQQQIAAAEKAASQIESPSLQPSDRVDLLGAKVPGSYFLDLRSYQPTNTAAALKIPILVLQGGHDYQVTSTDYALWPTALAGNPKAMFHFYPALTHLFIPAPGSGPASPADYEAAGHVSPEVIADIAGWVKANSGGQ